MAILGSKGIYNRDPSKMARYHVQENFMSIISGNTPYDSNESGFWGQYKHPAQITSNSVANTARTIVSISDKAGFFTFAMSSMGTAIVEFVVTVDGVATTIPNLRRTDNQNSRACIGAHSGWTATHQSNPNYGYSAGAITVPTEPFYASYGLNAITYTTPFFAYVPDPIYAIATQPSNIVRFEKSLIVTVKSAAAASNVDGYACAHYILDAV